MNKSNNQFSGLIAKALNNKDLHGYIEIGLIDDATANVIYNLTGIKVNNRKQLLFFNDIRHMINRHGDEKREIKRNQLPITMKDILAIPHILKHYNKIEIGSNNREGITIRYIKKYNKNIISIIEVIPKKSSLKIKTMWKTALDIDIKSIS